MSVITITNVGHNLLRDALRGANSSMIKYVALGSSNTAPTTSDTQLGNETFRNAVTAYTNGATGEIFVTLYLSPADLLGGDIEEVGFFGGSSAMLAANTGVLLARGLWSHPSKTNVESIQFQLDLLI